jgi:hypothetical protein
MPRLPKDISPYDSETVNGKEILCTVSNTDIYYSKENLVHLTWHDTLQKILPVSLLHFETLVRTLCYSSLQ